MEKELLSKRTMGKVIRKKIYYIKIKPMCITSNINKINGRFLNFKNICYMSVIFNRYPENK